MHARSPRRILWTLGAATVLATPTLYADQQEVVYYVRTTGSDTRSGLSAATAFRTIQKAVGSCSSGGRRYTVYVGPGVYAEAVLVNSGAGASHGQPSSPNRIIGDVTGVNTGDAPGAVVVDGGGTRTYGIKIDGRRYWTLSFLTVRNQTTYGVQLNDCAGSSVTDCTIKPVLYGIYSVASDVVFDRNTFTRDRTTGSCIYATSSGQGDITIRRNWMVLSGADFLSSGYSTGNFSLLNLTRGFFGIFVATEWGPRCDIYIENNVITDSLLGVYASSGGNGGSDVFLSNNTMVGCLYPAYVFDNAAGDVVFRNTIASNCYYPASAYGGSPRAEGILSYGIRSGSLASSGIHSLSGVLTGDPKFVSPATGDFSLEAGSPGLDTGVFDSRITTDINGTLRPLDGNRDGIPVIDLGAFESSPSRLRITRVVESRPAPARVTTTTLTRLQAPKSSRNATGDSSTAGDNVRSLLRSIFSGNR